MYKLKSLLKSLENAPEDAEIDAAELETRISEFLNNPLPERGEGGRVMVAVVGHSVALECYLRSHRFRR